jgi:formate C-acetyltransferase
MKKKFLNYLINIYRRYLYLFQGKPFSIVALFYKYNRVAKSPLQALGMVLSHFGEIKAYGGKRSREKVLKRARFDSEGCHYFIYTWDVYKSVKIKGKVLKNCTIDYRKILDYGLSHYYMDGDDEFAQDNNSLLDAMLEYIDRLAVYVVKSGIANKENIVCYLKRFKDEPAQCLEEALQRILVINEIQWQLGHSLVGIGRLDYCLDMFEEKEDVARPLFTEFFTLLHKYFPIKSNALMGDTGQIVIVGGRSEDGREFSNLYTSLIIDVIQGLHLPDPKVFLRVNRNMDDGLWGEIINVMSSNTGSPLISNDDEIIEAMVAYGYDRKDANNYMTSACWEPVAGNCYEQNNLKSLNYLEPLVRISEKHDLKKIDSFDRLMELYDLELAGYIKDITDYLDSIKWEKDVMYSMFDSHARKVRRDVSVGGCKYNNYGILSVAMANAVNSIYNIREFVFEKNMYTYGEIDGFRRDDFKGHEDVYGVLKNAKKYWGMMMTRCATL